MAVSAISIPRASLPGWRRRLSIAQDGVLIVVSALFFYAHARHAITAGSATSIFFGTEQALLVGIFLFRRRPLATSTRPLDWCVAAIGGWGSLAMRPHDAGGAAEAFGIALQCTGLAMVSYCFLTLGKSFGVVAANRGLKVHGPYRIVRHPIYLSHTVTLAGFVVANWAGVNVAIFATVCAFQLLRIRAEERVLSDTSDYGAYRENVRFRIFPGIY